MGEFADVNLPTMVSKVKTGDLTLAANVKKKYVHKSFQFHKLHEDWFCGIFL